MQALSQLSYGPVGVVAEGAVSQRAGPQTPTADCGFYSSRRLLQGGRRQSATLSGGEDYGRKRLRSSCSTSSIETPAAVIFTSR